MVGKLTHEDGILRRVLNSPTANRAVTPLDDVAVSVNTAEVDVRAVTTYRATSGNPNAAAIAF